MSMFRRRLISSLSKKVDYLEGKRVSMSATNQSYRLGVEWLSDDTVRLYHLTAGFMGPQQAGKIIFGDTSAHSSGLGVAMTSGIKTPLLYTEIGKKYKLTMEIIEVNRNTATTDNDGKFYIGFGRGSAYTTQKHNISNMIVGTKFEITRTYSSSYSYIGGAGFEPNNPNLLWDFIFKVKVEEV